MIYHEKIAVSSLHRELSRSKPFYHELTDSHEFTDAESKVRDMMEHIELYKNPFQITERTWKQLHNIVSQEIMLIEVRENMHSVESKGNQLYTSEKKGLQTEPRNYLTQFTGIISKHSSLSKL